jgi:hypothetical protein
MRRTVSQRTLLRHRHIFIRALEDGKTVVEVWDFDLNKAVISQIAQSPNDEVRYVSNWAKSHRVPPEAIIRDKTPKQYRDELERKLDADQAYR